MRPNRKNIETPWPDKVTWLASQIFTAFPQECTGLRFYILNCGCIYYKRLFRKGDIDPQIGIYRDANDGPCEICMLHEKTWKDRMADEMVVFNSKFQVEFQ